MVKMTKLQKHIAEMIDENPSVSAEELLDEMVIGAMLKTYGLAETGNWSLPFADFESQELICCPGCSAVLVDESGFLPKEVIHDIL